MDLSKLVAVSGTPGVFKLVSNRSNGLIVEDLDNGKKKFVSSRKHQFTPLETISIYTNDDDTAELKAVFQTMIDQMETNPPVATNLPSNQTRAYFEKILPDYDVDRVYVSDIKKLIKWFNFLYKREMLNPVEEESAAVEEESAAVEEETTAEEKA